MDYQVKVVDAFDAIKILRHVIHLLETEEEIKFSAVMTLKNLSKETSEYYFCYHSPNKRSQ